MFVLLALVPIFSQVFRCNYSINQQRRAQHKKLETRRTQTQSRCSPLADLLYESICRSASFISTCSSDRSFNRDTEPSPPDKTEKEIQSEIQALYRQITASVTFLPQLDGNCTFNVLVYADADSDVPIEWGDSDAKEIKNAEKVQLRSFSTSNHKVDTLVSYR